MRRPILCLLILVFVCNLSSVSTPKPRPYDFRTLAPTDSSVLILHDIAYSFWDCVDTTVVSITEDVGKYRQTPLEVGNQVVTVYGKSNKRMCGQKFYVGYEYMYFDRDGQEKVMYFSEEADIEVWDVGFSFSFLLDFGSSFRLYNGIFAIKFWMEDDSVDDSEEQKYADSFWINLDNLGAKAYITKINGRNIKGKKALLDLNHEPDPYLWVDWSDGLIPDDSVQTDHRVKVWLKNSRDTSDKFSWTACGDCPSSCNAHFVDFSGVNLPLYGDFSEQIVKVHLVATIEDRWGNGSNRVEDAMRAFNEGRYITLKIIPEREPAVLKTFDGKGNSEWFEQ